TIEPARPRPTKWMLVTLATIMGAITLFFAVFHEAVGTQSRQSTAIAANTKTATITGAELPRPETAATKSAELPLPKPVATKSIELPLPKPVATKSAEPKSAGLPLPNAATTKSVGLPLPKPVVHVDTQLQPTVEETISNQLSFEIASGDTLDELFAKHKLSRADLAQILQIKDARSHLQLLIPGDKLTVKHNQGKVLQLRRILDEENTLDITRTADSFSAQIVVNPVEKRVAHAFGRINSSLFLAARDIGISDTLIMNLAGIFAWDVDFVLDIRQGDSFTVLYEELWQDGEKLRDGEILAAEFTNSGNTFRAVRFEDPDGETGYFTPEGLSVKKAFLRAPIAITPRVTSNFNPRRMHPVKKKVLPHTGVDYRAPTGTPIKAAGDGKVIFRGRKGGYGNAIILQHGGNITTLYAHLSKFHRRAGMSKRVKQGQIIGYSGATGTVTAAHLHYEYRVSGVHRNPRTVKLPKARPVAGKHRANFAEKTAPLLQQLDVLERSFRLAAGDAL
ncbi:MAG: peptidoglycan DD-metalloendopeptidase family protein, partial [Gammaproteobacteria bacterium]|nr:peptidoglycan DD-metalloendopeptidase family protein [Gammaproteobacteria bacterium]